MSVWVWMDIQWVWGHYSSSIITKVPDICQVHPKLVFHWRILIYFKKGACLLGDCKLIVTLVSLFMVLCCFVLFLDFQVAKRTIFGTRVCLSNTHTALNNAHSLLWKSYFTSIQKCFCYCNKPIVRSGTHKDGGFSSSQKQPFNKMYAMASDNQWAMFSIAFYRRIDIYSFVL